MPHLDSQFLCKPSLFLGQSSDVTSDEPYVPDVHWRYHKFLDDDVRALPRLAKVWNDILMRKDYMKLALPETREIGRNPGSLFQFTERMVEMAPLLQYFSLQCIVSA